MNARVNQLLRHYCPNIPALRRWLAERKIKEFQTHFLKAEIVNESEFVPEKRREAVNYFIKTQPQFASQVIDCYENYISKISDQTIQLQMKALREDVLFTCFAYGFSPDEYFLFHLENRTLTERKSFITDQERNIMVYRLNDVIDVGVFHDKYQTYLKYKKYYKRKAILIKKEKNKADYLRFVKQYPIFVQKEVSLSRGNSVELVDICNTGMSAEKYYEYLKKRGTFILEEKIIQSSYMSILNKSSVNTVRCITFKTKKGVVVGACFLKVGRKNSFVDNGGSGGILVGIDINNGILCTNGFDEILNEYPSHPDTGLIFRGYQLPEWSDMIDLARELSEQSPSVRYIGWDMAHTNSGWIVVEGNGGSQMIGPQIVFQRGFKKDIQELLGGDCL